MNSPPEASSKSKGGYKMRLFCFKDHEEAPDPPRDLKQELIEAKAELARLKLLPDESFTRFHQYMTGMILEHGIDRKPKQIAKQKATVAELSVLVKAVKT